MPDMHRHEVDEVTCCEFVELVSAYWEGVLSEERMELVEEHLVICDSCKTYLEQMELTVEALPEAGGREPVPEETERVLLSAFRNWKARD